MKTISAGEIWTISLGDQPREVTVVASASPGWWRCVDLQTRIAFTASERWFLKPHDAQPRRAPTPTIFAISLLFVLCSCSFALAEAPEPSEGVVEPSAAEIIEGKVVGVTDGDTISVLDGKKTIQVRLEGIDAPESHQAYGTQSRKALFAKVYGKQVRVECRGLDRYGRVLGDVLLGSRNINNELVEEGWAWHFKKYSTSQKLADLETKARELKVGLWDDESPEPPWEFRKKQAPVVQERERPPPKTRAEPPAEKPVAEVTVYVTKTGEKYHRDGCQYLRLSKIPIPLSQAQKTHEPCSRCKPP
jgi:endonuclease YncB( thermonuclease family)